MDQIHLTTCEIHKNLETTLSCGKCNRNVCSQCYTHTPVGIRCNECQKTPELPIDMLEVKPFLISVVAGIGGTVFLGLLWKLIFSNVPISFPPLFIGIAYLVGEIVSIGSGRKRGKHLGALTIICMIVLVIVSDFYPYRFISVQSVYWLIIVAAGFYMALSRVR